MHLSLANTLINIKVTFLASHFLLTAKDAIDVLIVLKNTFCLFPCRSMEYTGNFSNPSPWIFSGLESLRWLSVYMKIFLLPLGLCILQSCNRF